MIEAKCRRLQLPWNEIAISVWFIGSLSRSVSFFSFYLLSRSYRRSAGVVRLAISPAARLLHATRTCSTWTVAAAARCVQMRREGGVEVGETWQDGADRACTAHTAWEAYLESLEWVSVRMVRPLLVYVVVKNCT